MGRHAGALRITNTGFQFLLQDVGTQIWQFLLQYLSVAEDQQMDLVEVLNFLFMLGSLELGMVGTHAFLAYLTHRTIRQSL